MSVYDKIARLYDPWSVSVVEDVGFYVAEAVRSGGPVLELGVGTGRIAVPTARVNPPPGSGVAAQADVQRIIAKIEAAGRRPVILGANASDVAPYGQAQGWNPSLPRPRVTPERSGRRMRP